MPLSVRFRFTPGRWAVCALAALSLTACGGGGGSGSSGGGTANYTIGGNISGLTASGLVLTDNGADNLTVSSGATTFTFSQTVASGGNYSVAVATQPTGETCTVSSGSGMANANVTSIAVTCSVNTYTVGGAVAGLNASGLVLADNGGDNLTVPSGATSFTFATKLSSGSSYDVTVIGSPTGETCTVSSGTGKITANVTNVAISCTTNTYTIGGTISGLNASGLVLQDNGTDNLTVNSGSATFTFSTMLVYGANYSVTVSSQPIGETCSVASGGSGTVTNTVTNVSVTCTTNTFSISGSASGLTAAGLQLQFYATGQIQSVQPVASGSAPYTYANVPYGTSIAMAIKAQPGWETCAASSSDFSGILTGAVTGENLTCTADTPTSNAVTLAGGVTLSGPNGVAVDASGNVYVADTNNNRVLMISSGGTVTAFTGTTSTPFKTPDGIAVDAHGDVFVADTGNNLIREIVATNGAVSASSTVETVGSGTFSSPEGVAVDSSGNVYVANTFGNDILEIVATNGSVTASSTVTAVAGGVTTGCQDGNGTAAEFDQPTGIAVDSAGNLYVADSQNNVIRKITSVGGSNSVITWAGGEGTCNSLSPATSGYVDGAATTAALFAQPTGVAVDSAGNVFVADLGNSAVREVTPAGVVSTIAGATPPSGGTTTIYSFANPFGITVSSTDTLYVGDTGNAQIVALAP